MRARMALVASGQQCELREVALKNKPATMLQVSPKGTVPVLVLPDHTVIDESIDIMHWALNSGDPLHWLPDDEVAKVRWSEWITRCDGDFKALLDRYKYPHRFGASSGNEYRDQALPFLQTLQRELSDSRYLGGKRFGMVDAAIAPFVRQFAHTDKEWFTAQPFSLLQAWLHAFEKSEMFDQVMEKHDPWIEGQPAVVWPAMNIEFTNRNEIMMS